MNIFGAIQQRFYLFSVGMIVLGIFIGSSLTYVIHNYSPHEVTPVDNRLNDKTYKFINPLLDYSSSPHPPLRKDMSELEDDLYKLIDSAVANGEINSASVYYRDLENGPWLSIYGDLLFTPASLLKIPLLIAYYKKAEENRDILSTKIKYSTAPKEILVATYDINVTDLILGQEYTVDELLNKMIIESNNVAALLLLNHIDNSTVEKVFTDLDVPLPYDSAPTERYLEAKEYASFLRILYNSTYLNREYSERALLLMSNTAYTKGLVAGLPSDAVVSHKFGVYLGNGNNRQLHDCGIVYHPKIRTSLICVMTNGNDYNTMDDTIANISSLIFRHLEASNSEKL